MGLLAGGSLKYEAPVPEFARYEPTGTWMAVAEEFVTFSNDGINWQKAQWAPSSFWNARDRWEFVTRMVIPAGDIFGAAFRMTNTNPVQFTISTPGPNPGADDEFDPAFRMSHGTGGFSATSTGVIRSSGDADNWLEELPVPGSFADAGIGKQQFQTEVGLHIRLGQGEFAPSAGNYWTSGNGKSWTERVFPEHFSSSPNVDWMVGNEDDAVVVGLSHNGRIYRTLDGVNWSLRHNPFPATGVGNIAWNPQANNGVGAFFAVMFGVTNPDNLLTSPDGIFWNAVDPNDLPISGDIASDFNKNLMICRQSLAAQDPEFGGGNYMSDDDGETWKEFGDREGGFLGFIDLKIGPIVNETVFIDTGAIAISETRAAVASTNLSLDGSNDEANGIDEFTIGGGTVSLGKWADTLDELNPFYYQCRLDRISGDDFTDGSPIDEWIDFNGFWRYLLNAGPETRSMTGTLRVRHKETLVESNSVTVSITATVTA